MTGPAVFRCGIRRTLPRNLLLAAKRRGIARFCYIYIQFKVFSEYINYHLQKKTIKSSHCILRFCALAPSYPSNPCWIEKVRVFSVHAGREWRVTGFEEMDSNEMNE